MITYDLVSSDPFAKGIITKSCLHRLHHNAEVGTTLNNRVAFKRDEERVIHAGVRHDCARVRLERVREHLDSAI